METILLAGLTLQAWLVIATVIAVFGLMLFTNLPADFVFLGSMAFLLLTGALPEAEVLSCFSSSTVILIGVQCLFHIKCKFFQTKMMRCSMRFVRISVASIWGEL